MALTVLVEHIMVTEIRRVYPAMKLLEVAEFLILNRISGAPIVDRTDTLISLIGEGGILRLAASEGLDATIAHCLPKLPKVTELITLKRNDTAIDAYKIFIKNPIHRIPIVDSQGKLLGLISRGTIVRMFIEAHHQKRLPPGL